MVRVARRPQQESQAHGPAAVLVALPKRTRRAVTLALFGVAAGVIVLNAAPFSEGLIQSGELFGVNQFLLVQWLAPIASEAPEFIVALMLAFTGRAALGLGSLLSAKVNQWTLLVGMIPWVYAVAHRTLAHPIPMGHFQMDEILLTAAQSLLAVVILGGLRLSLGHGILLFGLFAAQLVAPVAVGLLPAAAFSGVAPDDVRQFFATLYFVATAALILDSPGRLRAIWTGYRCGAEPFRLGRTGGAL